VQRSKEAFPARHRRKLRGLETPRSPRNILFSFAAERAANEKQSASGGLIIASPES